MYIIFLMKKIIVINCNIYISRTYYIEIMCILYLQDFKIRKLTYEFI